MCLYAVLDCQPYKPPLLMHTLKAYGRVPVTALHILNLRSRAEISGQFHTPATLASKEQPLDHQTEDAVRDPQPV